MERQRFSSLLDMIDGGGMGAQGSEFQGGGLLSDIGNALFQPRGYRDRVARLGEVRPQMRPQTMGNTPAQVQPMMPDGPAGAGGALRGPGMPGGPMPMQTAPRMPQDPTMPNMLPPASGGQLPGPMMPGGPMPQEVSAPAPMGIESAMAQLEAALTPSERQTLQSMPMDQRMGMIQRLIQMRQGGI